MINEIVLYKPNEQFQLEVQVKDETVWLTQQQIAALYGVKVPAISKHLANIFRDGELDKDSVISILENTAADGTVYHCGHSLKDMGKKLCAITQIGTNPEDILKQVS